VGVLRRVVAGDAACVALGRVDRARTRQATVPRDAGAERRQQDECMRPHDSHLSLFLLRFHVIASASSETAAPAPAPFLVGVDVTLHPAIPAPPPSVPTASPPSPGALPDDPKPDE